MKKSSSQRRTSGTSKKCAAGSKEEAQRKERVVDPNYSSLFSILIKAYDRASLGKGQRHVTRYGEKQFHKQDIVQELLTFEDISPALFQIRKKAKELDRFHEVERKQAELLDIIVYACGAYIALDIDPLL